MMNPMMQQMQMMQMQQMQLQQMMMMGNMMGNMMMGGGGSCSPMSMMGGQVQATQSQPVQEQEEEIDIPAGASSTVGHPNYRPPDAETVPGVTDKRFEGRIRLWWDAKGHGLIECEEVRLKFPGQDGVFLHDSQRRHFKKGDAVSFGVFVNFRGRPQATELRRPKQSEV